MLPELEKLVILQDRDSRRFALQKELEQIPKDEARVKTHLSNDLANVASAKDAIKQNTLATQALELDIDTRRTTIDRLKVQQFETKKNDEYRALEGEIKRYGDMVDELETQQLELMDTADMLQQNLAGAEDALAKTQGLVNEELASFEKRRQASKTEIAELEAERSNISGDIPAATLKMYERLLLSKDGQALAQVHGEQCGGCHMKLVKPTLATLRAHKEIAQCENCSRMLYEV